MGSGNDTKAEQGGSVAANRYLRRAVDKCVGDGIERDQVAEALVRMAETVHSEIAEERAEYRATRLLDAEAPDSIDQVPVGKSAAAAGSTRPSTTSAAGAAPR